MKKKNAWVWALAGITAVAGIAVALAVFIKRAGKKFQDDLDFDDSIYFEEDADLPELDEDALPAEGGEEAEDE